MRLTTVQAVRRASALRKPGYIEAVLAAANRDGDKLGLTEEEFTRIRDQFSIPPSILNSLQEPTLGSELSELAAALAEWTASGFKLANSDQIAIRRSVCIQCDFWDRTARVGLGRCRRCGCTRIKWWIETESCPASKWPINPPSITP